MAIKNIPNARMRLWAAHAENLQMRALAARGLEHDVTDAEWSLEYGRLYCPLSKQNKSRMGYYINQMDLQPLTLLQCGIALENVIEEHKRAAFAANFPVPPPPSLAPEDDTHSFGEKQILRAIAALDEKIENFIWAMQKS
jgi:hypothetical protein